MARRKSNQATAPKGPGAKPKKPMSEARRKQKRREMIVAGIVVFVIAISMVLSVLLPLFM